MESGSLGRLLMGASGPRLERHQPGIDVSSLRRKTVMVSLAVVVILGVVPACAGDEHSSSPPTTTKVDSWPALARYNEQLSDTQYFASVERMTPPHATDWARDSMGLVRGTVLGIERGGPKVEHLGQPSDNLVISTVTVRLRLKLTGVTDGIADRLSIGETVAVEMPVWSGPPGSEQLADEWVRPLVSADAPPGTEALLVVRRIDGDVVSSSNPDVIFVGAPQLIFGTSDGRAVVHLGDPPRDGTVFGLPTLSQIQQAAGTAPA